MTAHEAYVAFNLTGRVGSVTLSHLVSRYGDEVTAWEAYGEKITSTGERVDWQREIGKAEASGVHIVTPVDPEYPKSLLRLPSHPLALYVKGAAGALSRPMVAIVGTRRATPYGLDQAFQLARDLARFGWGVVSGLALGIDAEAHRGALAVDGLTVGVLGGALNRFYPTQNIPLAREIIEKGGAVVTEFPFGRSPDKQTFPQRNHIVAALSRGVIAVESPVKSGTLITCNIAAELGIIVMAVPGRVDARASAGCLALIREGATLVRNASDVEETLGSQLRHNEAVIKFSGEKPLEKTQLGEFPQPPPGTPDEERIMAELDKEGLSIDELVRRTGLDAAKVNALAMTLIMKKRVRSLPGNRIALPRD